ncbi:MAG: hypothetical protein ABSF68_09450 [Candidatus Acidiferrales bacterium]
MKHPAQQPAAIRSVLLKSLLGISFAAVLALAPAPAFAQHGGGGGGGGGSHGGGGGGGGSHGSSGGGHASSGSGSGSHAASNASSSSTGGHWWNPFHGSGANNAAGTKAGGTASAGNAANSTGTNSTTRFAAGNNVWQEPPANTHASTNAPSHFYATSNRDAATAKPVQKTTNNTLGRAGISQNALRQRPIIIYYPYNPYGFGFGSPFGYGFGCDPWLWGCPAGLGFGFAYGGGFGYGAGLGYYGGGYGTGYDGAYGGGSDMTFESNGADQGAPNGDMASAEGNAGEWQNAPENNSQPADTKAQPYVVIFLRDGSSYAVSDYWLAEGKLHYVTSYGGENSVDANQIDLQRTVNENSAHGVTFTLRPAGATDAPKGKQNLQPPPSNDGQTSAPNPQ